MDIATLASRVGLSTRRLRYVLDQKLLPGLKKMAPGRGVPRSFDEFSAFTIALAGFMLEMGLKKNLVDVCITSALNYEHQERSMDNVPLYLAYQATSAWLELGDGAYFRIRAESPHYPRRSNFETPWTSLQDGVVVPKKYEPFIKVVIDLGNLRKKLR